MPSHLKWRMKLICKHVFTCIYDVHLCVSIHVQKPEEDVERTALLTTLLPLSTQVSLQHSHDPPVFTSHSTGGSKHRKQLFMERLRISDFRLAMKGAAGLPHMPLAPEHMEPSASHGL